MRPPRSLSSVVVVGVLVFLLALVDASMAASLRGADAVGDVELAVRRRSLDNAKRQLTCAQLINFLCGPRCKGLCLNKCYIDFMAEFNAIGGRCHRAHVRGRLPGARVGSNDFDHDGVINSRDPDVDNDGIPNALDEDNDNDGMPDDVDSDDDNDGIPDSYDNDGSADPTDTDYDGTIDSIDDDDNNNGIPDNADPAPKATESPTTKDDEENQP